MPNIIREAATAVVKDLGPFEMAVDIALAQSGRFLASLTEGRLEAQLAPAATHPAIMSTLTTITALGQARDGMVNTRRELILTRTKLGLGEVAIGGLMGCPNDPTGPTGSLVDQSTEHAA